MTVRLGLRRLGWVIPFTVFVAAGHSVPAAPPTFSTQRVITFASGQLPFDVRTETARRERSASCSRSRPRARVATAWCGSTARVSSTPCTRAMCRRSS
jgi:hypothetical protein